MDSTEDAAVAYLRRYLQDAADRISADLSFESLLAEVGVTYPVPSRPRPRGFRKMRDKGCFTNSWRAAESNGWTYVEGYGLLVDPVFPVHHAWCLDADGTVVETTWEEAALAYIGLPLEPALVARVLARQGFLPVFPSATRIWREYCSEVAQRAAGTTG